MQKIIGILYLPFIMIHYIMFVWSLSSDSISTSVLLLWLLHAELYLFIAPWIKSIYYAPLFLYVFVCVSGMMIASGGLVYVLISILSPIDGQELLLEEWLLEWLLVISFQMIFFQIILILMFLGSLIIRIRDSR